MNATKATFDGKVRQRRSRAIQPWIDRDTGKVADLSKKELASQAAVWPLKTLVEELSTDSAARKRVIQLRAEIGKLMPLEEEFGEAVRGGEEAAIQKAIEGLEDQEKVISDLLANTARRYVRRKGRSQEVVMEIFRRAAESTREDTESAFRSLWSRAVWVSSELDENDPKQWGHAGSDPLIARKLAYLGAGRCTYEVNRIPGEYSSRGAQVRDNHKPADICGVKISSFSGKTCHCLHHEDHGSSLTKNEREQITEFLHRVGRSLNLEA